MNRHPNNRYHNIGKNLAILLLGFVWAPLSLAQSTIQIASEKPRDTYQNIVSLDYCADQYAIALVDHQNVGALSIESQQPYSYLRDEAKRYAQIKPNAESVLSLQPDLIIRSYGGGPNAKAFYESLNIKVVQLGYSQSIADIQSEILRLADELNQPSKGHVLVANMRKRLNRLEHSGDEREVLYLTSGGVTSGSNTLIDELITAAGFNNFEKRPGWHDIPLETLTHRQPELLATAFYQQVDDMHYWSAARHPIIRSQLGKTTNIALNDATTACGGWFILDAIEALVKGAGL